MSDAIVVLNAGSSSLKFSLYAVEEKGLRLLVRGQIEGLGTSWDPLESTCRHASLSIL